MASMFQNTPFNGDISNWEVSNVTRMDYMFSYPNYMWFDTNYSSFNQDISTWDVSNVTTMESMFSGAIFFNSDISNWNVSVVERMRGMLNSATNFNQDLSSWDVSSVLDMAYMFQAAESFNQDISTWDVSSANNLSYMFQAAESFNQDISTWDVINVWQMTNMFGDALPLSDENKCAIHTSFSLNNDWDYDWSESCELSLSEFSLRPEDFTIYQNYPNPFNPFTTLRYDLPEDGLVDITIYDMLGNVVSNLINTNQSSGYKSIQWDATNNQGEPVSAGVYLYKIQAGDFVDTKKMILLK